VSEFDRRKHAERAFHNERFGGDQDKRQPLNKWYIAVSDGARVQSDAIKKLSYGAGLLEIGCAEGRLSLLEEQFAQIARTFHGIDISDKAIDRAREAAKSLELKNCQFDVMDAENLAFGANEFDLVFGRGVIHHLDLRKCFSEVARVLKPGGKAIFYEPMGHNPLINTFRRYTPHLRTIDEHPLLASDFALAREFFKEVDTQFYGLVTIPFAPIGHTAIGRGALRLAGWADKLLLKIPTVGHYAWYVVLTLAN
jgi:SAM-dependent methyltransferase